MLIKRTNNINSFYTLYVKTLNRINAKQYFKFSLTNLEKIQKRWGEIWEIEKNNKIICSYIILKTDNELFYFLGANDTDALNNGFSTLLFTKIANHYVNNNNKILFLGGGQKGVHQFKSGFSKKRFPYFIGKNIL